MEKNFWRPRIFFFPPKMFFQSALLDFDVSYTWRHLVLMGVSGERSGDHQPANHHHHPSASLKHVEQNKMRGSGALSGQQHFSKIAPHYHHLVVCPSSKTKPLRLYWVAPRFSAKVGLLRQDLGWGGLPLRGACPQPGSSSEVEEGQTRLMIQQP